MPQPVTNYEAKFFAVPAGTHPAVIRVIEKIKQQNSQHHFVNEFVQKFGLPKWEHAMIQPRKSRLGVRSFDVNGGDTLVLIPVASELQEKIKNVLECEVNADDVLIKLIRDYTYSYFGYEPNEQGKATAKDVAALFMKFEMKVYNKRIFHIKDVLLAKKIVGDEWEDKLTTLILKEDPLTNEIGFYKTISAAVVPVVAPEIPMLPEVIITAGPSTQPIVFPVFPGIPLGGGSWWTIGNDFFGLGDAGGGFTIDAGGNGYGNGGGGSSGGGGGSGSGSNGQQPGWEEPPCGGVWVGESTYKQFKCPENQNQSFNFKDSDSIPNVLSLACDQQSDSVFNWGINNNFREQSFILVLKDGKVYPKNFTSGVLNGTKTRVNYTLAFGEKLVGYLHTHPVENDPTGRSFFSFDDIQEARKNAHIPKFCALLECGNKRFALVIENTAKLNAFITIDKLKELKADILTENTMQLPVYNSNRQQASITAVINYFGSSELCGISFYEASEPNKNTFTKLNP